MGICAKYLWPDALPVANQQESFTGPHPFSNLSDSQTGEWASLPLCRLSDTSTVPEFVEQFGKNLFRTS